MVDLLKYLLGGVGVLIVLAFAFWIALKFYVKKMMNSSVPAPYRYLFNDMENKEKTLKETNAQLQSAIQTNQLFTDILRHDLLNPAGVIRNNAEIQLMEKNTKKQHESLEMIKSNSEKLIEMIENASMYSKLEGVNKLEKKEMDLNIIFKKVISDFETKLKENKIKMRYLVKGKKMVSVNPMIEHVFINLLSNAIKYSPQGSKIEIGIFNEGEKYRIYVKDWGYGVEKQFKDKIFSRFERADKQGIKGTGLGLAIVKRIVEAHGGKVWVEDNSEKGSVFCVELLRS